MRAVVTDATGRIGRAVIALLAQSAGEIVGLTDDDSAEIEGAALRGWPKRPGDLARLLAGADMVFALGLGGPEEALEQASGRASTLIAAAGKAGVKRFVLLGSEEVYDAAARARGTVRETGPFTTPDKATPRGRAAGLAEQALRDVPGPMERTVLRAPAVYGLDSPGVDAAVSAILGAGQAQSRMGRFHGIHVDDLARALVAAGRTPRAAGQAFNVAEGFSLSDEVFEAEILRLGRLLTDQASNEDRVRPEYPLMPPVLATDKAARLLDFAPRGALWASLAEVTQAVVMRMRGQGSAVPAVAPGSAPVVAIEKGETPLRGKTVVLTGATAGIGRATALMLARLGADLALVARNPEKGKALLAEIESTSPRGRAAFYAADLSSQSDIRRVAAEISARHSRIDVLINNAGGMFGSRALSSEGIEMNLALNHLAPFLLTNLLSGRLMAAKGARIITLTSEAHRGVGLDFSDLQSMNYDSYRAYSLSKLANVYFTYALAARLEGTGAGAFALHPGGVATEIGTKNQGLADEAWAQLTQNAITPERAARYVANLAMSPEFDGTNGLYLNMAEVTQSAPQSYDRAVAEQLWTVSERMTGLVRDAA